MAKPERFSDRRYAAPFGRFEASTEAESPADEVLIGREGQRAYFIDILLRAGRRGAFLVTGHRGVGKSSFVYYCLKEYESEVFDRFLRSNVGRTLFWDRSLVLLLLFAAPLFLLMLSQLMELLTLAALKAGGRGTESPPSFLLWVVVAPLLIVCVYPLLYGWELLSDVFRTALSRPKASLWASVSAVILLGLIWGVRPFGAPALSLSRWFCVLASLYLWVRSSSFERPRNDLVRRQRLRHLPSWNRRVWARRERRRLFWHTRVLGHPAPFFLAVLPSFLLGVVPFGALPGLRNFPFFHERISPDRSYWANLAIGLIFFGMGSVLQGWHQMRSDGSERHAVRKSGALVYLGGGLTVGLITILGLGSGEVFTPIFALIVCALSALVFVAVRRWYRRWWSGIEGRRTPEVKRGAFPFAGFRPRPRQALLIKAAISLTIGVHLIFPVAEPLLRKLVRPRPVAEALCRLTGAADRWLSIDRCGVSGEYCGSLMVESTLLRCPAPLWRIATVAPPLFPPEFCDQGYLTGTGSWAPPLWDRKECEVTASAPELQPRLFHGRREEILWVFASFLSMLAFYFLDYEWVARPYLAERSDRALDPKGRARRNFEREPWIEPHGLRNLARATLPWTIHRAWLPMINVSVNLGFERLDHRRVIQAMLVGLREQYRRIFQAWNSGIANLGRGLALVTLLAVVTLVGQRWFALPKIESHEMAKVQISVDHRYRDICSVFDGAQSGSSAVHLVCGLKWGDKILQGLFFNLLDTEVDIGYEEGRGHLLFMLLPYQPTDWPPEGLRRRNGELRPALVRRGVHFRVYHLALLLTFFFFGRTILRRIPLFPYRDIVSKIDNVLENLTGSTSSTSRVGRWPLTKWLEGFPLGEQVRQIQHEPFDPRTIEFEFLQVLKEIQEAAIDLPGARSQRISLPVPEITFFFDELDKLGTRVEPAVEGGTEPQQAEILNAERRRSMELHKLLADMKNLLSVAPARFIFVGGRNLHDEWLADQTSRLPLLTSIFQSEVYLPSLLTDRPNRDDPERLPERIEQFLVAQRERAQTQFESYHGKLFVPSFALRLEERWVESFVDPAKYGRADGRGGLLSENLKILDLEGNRVHGQVELLRDFLQFMTYRSLGNPKRLRELLAWFVRPVGRYVGATDLRERSFCCDHVLLFDEVERFRIQLLARIYRHINFTFDQGFSRHDDKMTVSVFYLSDFLFKFHRRAFSWSSLERVEDMVQIHRAPDLREVMETMVEHWAERFLHRIRNGMYDFRFRSELAREVEYISRHSPAEMAAFNFTLDESRALKSIYETTIRRLKDGPGRELQDFVSGLGELHEFDQEFETARVHYRNAISLIDGELRAITGGSELLEKASPMMQVLAGWKPGPEQARRYLTWGIARLRLMLQVGMTFELARNHERASVEYDNAATLARAMQLALLDDEGRALAVAADISRVFLDSGEDRLDVLKHLNILFQPVFAGAWVAEKLIGAVDTSTTLVESTLWELRAILPFVREPRVAPAGGPIAVGHSNFALIAAEIHNKAGDLYFLKGRQLVSTEAIEKLAEEVSQTELSRPRHGQEGYLLQAHYHYAVGLHELRRFTAYRRWSSAAKMNIKSREAFPDGAPAETLEREGWPDFVFRSLGGTLNDFAEVMIGRVSLYGMLRDLNRELPRFEDPRPPGQRRATETLVEACRDWMELISDRTASTSGSPMDGRQTQEEIDRIVGHRIVAALGDQALDCGTLGGWFGRWNESRVPHDKDRRLVEFEEWRQHDDLERLTVALNLMLVGGKFLEKGGYIEDAAREFLKVAEIATSYLWWWETIRRLVDWHSNGKRRPRPCLQYRVLELDARLCKEQRVREHPFWDYLGRVAMYGLEKADQLFRRSRVADRLDRYLVGDKVPVECLIGACSLGLVNYQRNAFLPELPDLVRSWLGPEAGRFDGTQTAFRSRLEETLERHSYPMLARLQGLKVLIDDSVLQELGAAGREPIRVLAHELYDLTERLSSPLHFTPMHSGTTYALVYLYFVEIVGCERSDFEIVRRAAQVDLRRSEEMYTLRRAFYESISDLFYLYDDFNDREVHFNHALQMAGSELVSMLRYLITSPDYEGVHETPLTIPETIYRGA